MLSLLLLFALAAPVEAQRCPFDHPPAWPSYCFREMDDESLRQLTLTRNGVPVYDFPEGVIILGWMGTSLKGDALHAWVYTREDKSVSSRLLHGDALERLYADVIAWLKEHRPKAPLAPDVPRLRVSR